MTLFIGFYISLSTNILCHAMAAYEHQPKGAGEGHVGEPMCPKDDCCLVPAGEAAKAKKQAHCIGFAYGLGAPPTPSPPPIFCGLGALPTPSPLTVIYDLGAPPTSTASPAKLCSGPSSTSSTPSDNFGSRASSDRTGTSRDRRRPLATAATPTSATSTTFGCEGSSEDSGDWSKEDIT